MKELNEKAIDSAKRYLESQGYSILERDWASPDGDGFSIIAVDPNDDIVFVDVTANMITSTGDFPLDKPDRSRCERLAVLYLKDADSDLLDHVVRFDLVDLLVFGDGKAFIRHYVNCFSDPSAVREDYKVS